MKTDRIDRYYTTFMADFEKPELREQKLAEINSLLGHLEATPVEKSCLIDVARLRERLKSLQVLGQQLRGNGASKNQFIDQKVRF